MVDLVIVGSVALDTVQTPHGKVSRALGGTATYASVAASYFAKTGIVGVVGGDFEPRHFDLLERRKIDLEGLQVVPRGRTFHWSGFYEGDMNHAYTRATRLNVFQAFTPIIPLEYRRAPFLFLGNIQPDLQLQVLRQMKRPRLVLCDTMNYWIKSERSRLERIFRRSHVICINDAEARQFTGCHALPNAARALLKLGPKRVIVKLGGYGVQMYGKNSFFALPALPLMKVKDPTGAGDTFAGGFIGSLCGADRLDEHAFRRAMATGTVMASFCVQDFSCRATANLTRYAIRRRIASLRALTYFRA
ncbi:MAG: PfkB family carbohydrate kinase [Candidatus Zixiibacteriota bacterium]